DDHFVNLQIFNPERAMRILQLERNDHSFTTDLRRAQTEQQPLVDRIPGEALDVQSAILSRRRSQRSYLRHVLEQEWTQVADDLGLALERLSFGIDVEPDDRVRSSGLRVRLRADHVEGRIAVSDRLSVYYVHAERNFLDRAHLLAIFVELHPLRLAA